MKVNGKIVGRQLILRTLFRGFQTPCLYIGLGLVSRREFAICYSLLVYDDKFLVLFLRSSDLLNEKFLSLIYYIFCFLGTTEHFNFKGLVRIG